MLSRRLPQWSPPLTLNPFTHRLLLKLLTFITSSDLCDLEDDRSEKGFMSWKKLTVGKRS